MSTPPSLSDLASRQPTQPAEEPAAEPQPASPSQALAPQVQPGGVALSDEVQALFDEVPDLAAALQKAGVGLDSDYGLLDIDGAMDEIGSQVPVLAIEYCFGREARDAGLRRGRFTLRSTLQQFDRLRCVLVAQKLQRSWRPAFDQDADEQAPPFCWSRDGRSPHDGSQMQRGPCNSCGYKNWRSESGKRKPPLCTAHILTLLLIVDESVSDVPMPVVMVFKRTALKTFRKAVNNITSRGLGWGQGLPRALKGLAVSFEMGTLEEGQFFRPTFSDWKKLEREQILLATRITSSVLPGFRQHVDLMTVDDADEEAEGAEAGISVGGGGFPQQAPGQTPPMGAPGGPAPYDDQPPAPGATDFNPGDYDERNPPPVGVSSAPAGQGGQRPRRW